MSLRIRTKSIKPSIAADNTTSVSSSDNDEVQSTRNTSTTTTANTTTSSPSLSQRAMTQTLASTAHLANLLPTGTLLAFQLLIPTFTNNGNCDVATRSMTQALLLLFATSCFLASFTDSFRSPDDGRAYYGFATFKGMWLFDYASVKGSKLPDLSNYRLRFIDGVHALLSVFVFVAIALRDYNVLKCFYPEPGYETREVLNILPIGIGVICSLLFVVFPTKRHGIGYPVSSGNS